MATPSKFNNGDLVNVYRQNGAYYSSGIITNVTETPEGYTYNVELVQNNSNFISTFKCVRETRLQPIQLAPEAADFISKLKECWQAYKERISASVGTFVLAGYAGAVENDNFYCYCGKGKGYNNASVAPANALAVSFDSIRKASNALKGKYYNGRNDFINLKPMPGDEYYQILQRRAKYSLLGCLSSISNH